MKRLTIVGAGLSGLYTAYLLQDRFDITILEARERAGGRILTSNGHDLGPSWVWPHHRHMIELIHSLGLERFDQYERGHALYQTPSAVQRFMPPPSPPASRVTGGLGMLVDSLEKQLEKTKIHYDSTVENIIQTGHNIQVMTKNKTFVSEFVVLAIPPRVALNISFEPPLPRGLDETLQRVPTWMGHARKCVITYNSAFWKEHNLSGFAFSHTGPVGELHDACTSTEAALFGFIHSHASTESLEEQVIDQLAALFGDDARNYQGFYFHDWRSDPLSSSHADFALREHPQYGYKVSHMENRLHFVSTEASFEEGGYLEGALIASRQMAQHLLSQVV